jgi:energy-coupling factor transporter ATP-binding protein EcfA2
MRIASLVISGFRCFGDGPEEIMLSDLTALVGANGCGKSTVLWALVRLFGTNQSERTLVRADFRLPAGKEWDEVDEANLRIEATLDFPELAGKAATSDDAVSACFKHMTVKEKGRAPYCRIRLDATWVKSNLPEGDIEQKLWWITSPLGTEEKDEKQQAVQPHERSRIHVHYVPASRDPARQIRQVSGSLLHTLLGAVHWSDDGKETISKASDTIRNAFGDEEGVKEIENAIVECWSNLHGAPEHKHVAIRPVAKRVEEIIRQVEATFKPGAGDKEDGIDKLSDGQRSLFYLAIVAALFDVQQTVGESKSEAISREKLMPPVLNLLAVEEPENHVAPHYLGRITKVLRRISESERGQVVLSSHSASIMSRVEPEEVRHLRTNMEDRTTIVRAITLPDEQHEQHKFIREAVRAYPELYFARFVIFGEGDSEEIVVPRLAEACGVPIDASLVSVVPLGGRHVNHFWNLLNQLEIPYLTLLDLDREREGGGWGRIKYAIQQLLALGHRKQDVLRIVGKDGKPSVLSDDALAEMHKRDGTNLKNMQTWIERLERFGVYFSNPLDLDFMMIQAFRDEYQATADGADGPDVPDEGDADYESKLGQVVKTVLRDADKAGETYTDAEKLEFFWYRYLFLGRSKPATHILALSKIADKDLAENGPEVLRRLVNRMKEVLEAAAASPVDEN